MHSGRRLTAEVSMEILAKMLLVWLITANVLFVRIFTLVAFLLVSTSQADKTIEISVLLASRYRYFVQTNGSRLSVK